MDFLFTQGSFSTPAIGNKCFFLPNVGDLCKDHIGSGAQGFKPYATNKKDAGVTILIRRDWEPLVIGKPTVSNRGEP